MRRTRPTLTGAAIGGSLALAFGAGMVALPAAADSDVQLPSDWQAVAAELLDTGADPRPSAQSADSSNVAAVGVDADGGLVIAVDGEGIDAGIDEARIAAYEDQATIVQVEGGFSALASTGDTVVGGAGIYSIASATQVSVCSVGFPAWDSSGQPAIVTAGHCADDGALTGVGMSVPSEDQAGSGDKDGFAPGPALGIYGFSQFGGPGNTAGSEIDPGTDIAVIDEINADLTLSPEITDWTTTDDLAASTTVITGVGAVDQNGAAIERSGRTTGHSSSSAANVGMVDGAAKIDGRFVRGFMVEDIAVDQGDSGGPVYQGETAIGIVSGGSPTGNQLWAADLQDALAHTDGYTIQLHIDAPAVTAPDAGGDIDAGEAITGTAPAGTTLVVQPVGGDEFTVDVDSDGTWSFDAPQELGDYAFSLQAENGYNASETVEHDVNVTLPAPAITAPADGDRVTEAISSVSGTGYDGATVHVTIDGEELIAEVAGGAWSVETDLGYGPHEVGAYQVFEEQQSATVTAAVTVAPAAPEITVPADGGFFAETELTDVLDVEGTGIDGATVTLLVDGEQAGTAVVTGGAWSIAVDRDFAPGDYTLAAVQTIDGTDSDETSIMFSVMSVIDEDPTVDPTDDPTAGPTDGPTDGPDRLPDTGASTATLPFLGAAAALVMLGVAGVIRRQRA
ncbi:trypsin-like serine protease [Pseudactinotalea sp. HY160]|uniref:trypsin-like serine protease n=1 Tax=Pseudactinotalea sp. HY160 TaxID=2654490 RepID=UPI00128C9391|nr:trypsin-like serine protease [Pseudactinotalea sp. HY160]MPV48467.1 trypsin-like serine protease [Pseudactinotalea sp. HY160]